MGYWKTDSEGVKTISYPRNGVAKLSEQRKTPEVIDPLFDPFENMDIYANEKGLVTKAGGNGNPDADPEVLVARGNLDHDWGLAHIRGFEWQRNIKSPYKETWNSEATLLPYNATMQDFDNRIRVWDYSYTTGDWRGGMVACTVHFSEPVWVTGRSDWLSGYPGSPRLKVICDEPGKSAVTIYLTYKSTDFYTDNSSPFYDQNYHTEVEGQYNAMDNGGYHDDYISSINVTNGGSGYVYAPKISFGPDDSAQLPLELPRAYAVVKDGEVTSINIIHGGSGYNYHLVPTVVFDNTGTGPPGGPDGGNAHATAIRTNRGDLSKGMTHKEFCNQYLYPNGSSSITFSGWAEDYVGFPETFWAPGTTFSIPENAIDLNGADITEGTSELGPPVITTNSALRGSNAGKLTVFHQLGEGWVYN